MHLAAVQNNGTSIEYIKASSEEIQLATIAQNKDAIDFIKNPCPSAVAAAKAVKMEYMGF